MLFFSRKAQEGFLDHKKVLLAVTAGNYLCITSGAHSWMHTPQRWMGAPPPPLVTLVSSCWHPAQSKWPLQLGGLETTLTTGAREYSCCTP